MSIEDHHVQESEGLPRKPDHDPKADTRYAESAFDPDLDVEIVVAFPGWVLRDAETGMKASGERYLETRQTLQHYVTEFDSYEEWLAERGSLFDKLGHSMKQLSTEMAGFGVSY